jgi:hypothetical protein
LLAVVQQGWHSQAPLVRTPWISHHPTRLYTSSASKNSLRGIKVTLVEGGDLSKIYNWDLPPNAFSNRVVSLTNATLDFLDGVLRLFFWLQLRY